MFTKKEIAVFLEMEPDDLKEIIESLDAQARKRFAIGRLKCEAEVRKSIFELAKNGSSPAQAFAFKLIENAKMDDL